MVTLLRHADRTRIAVREVEAGGAKANLLFCLNNGRSKPTRPLHVHVEDMVGKARSRLGSDAGQRSELLHELRERCNMLHLRGVPAEVRVHS